MRRPHRPLTALAALALAACRSSSSPSPPLPTNTPAAEAVAATTARPAMPLLTLRVAYDDPRLARARELERAKDPAGALRALREARPADLPADARCAWDYLEGRLAVAASATTDALAAFELARAPA
ncbi:MAG: Soluble lytic murein transglycosylase precursor, partial [Labilithrix sp.]|nr:Soluble lytic murein transglycosylase precursor [Labilithrix sp.]